MLHEKLTYALKGCIYDVFKELGLGYDEECYHLALEERLRSEGIAFQTKVSKYLIQRDFKVHKFVADLIIENTVILELKTIQTDFTPANYLQLFSYLKNWKKDLGLLVNFGAPNVPMKRVIFREKRPTILENYDEIKDYISPANKKLLRSLRTAIITILNTHGLGYRDSIYQKLLKAELEYQNISFVPQIFIPVKFIDKIVRHFPLETPIIGNQILCKIIAQKEESYPDISRIRTYLQDTNLPIGLLIYFGKENLKLIAVHR